LDGTWRLKASESKTGQEEISMARMASIEVFENASLIKINAFEVYVRPVLLSS